MLDFWISRTRAEAVGAVKCTAPDGKRSRGVYTRLHLLLIVGRATPTLSATLRCGGALSQARGSYCHHPHAVRTRVSTTRGIGKRARDDSPTSGRPERQRLCTSDSRFIRGQQLRQIVSRAWHGAHGRLRERVCWSGRTHEKAVGAVKCISRHGKALRSAYGGAQLQLLVIDRRRRQGARRCGDALARTWRLLTPPAGREHAHAHRGTSPKAPVPIRRCLLEPQRLDTSDPKQHASRDEPSLTDRQESVPRRTCGFGSVFIGLAAPTRRL